MRIAHIALCGIFVIPPLAVAQSPLVEVVTSDVRAYSPFEIEVTFDGVFPVDEYILVDVVHDEIRIGITRRTGFIKPSTPPFRVTVPPLPPGTYTFRMLERLDVDIPFEPASILVGGADQTVEIPEVDQPVPIYSYYNDDIDHYFVTADLDEIAVDGPEGLGWIYEGIAFQALLPIHQSCPAGTDSVWRLYNGLGDLQETNHRFVVGETTYQSMVATGWIGEGVAFCSPTKQAERLGY